MHSLHYAIKIVLLYILEASCFISRSPSCRYVANYTKIKDSKYFRGTVNTVIAGVTRGQCSLNCTLNHACLFYNHKKDNTTCELISSHLGTIVQNIQWQIISTDYTDLRYQGVYCRSYQPTTCNYAHTYCVDDCNPPYFRCVAYKNVINNAKVTASSTHSWIYVKKRKHKKNIKTRMYDYPTKAVDSSPATYWRSNTENPIWYRIELDKIYNIVFVRILSGDGIHKSHKFNIYVDSQLCITSRQGTDFKCSSVMIPGRVVKIEKYQDSVSPNHVKLFDVKVYALWNWYEMDFTRDVSRATWRGSFKNRLLCSSLPSVMSPSERLQTGFLTLNRLLRRGGGYFPKRVF